MILRAPQEHGQILAAPPLDQVGSLLERRLGLRSDPAHPIFGKPLAELRTLARREILHVSTQYHREAGEAVPDITSERWLVAGHQPELFHPGVWFKDFALHQLTAKHAAVALNLIVDTDSAKPPLLHVPVDDRIARIAFDRSVMDTPYEERVVAEEATFADLPNRVAPLAARWPFAPMLPAFWQEVLRQAARTPLLGERFAAARRTFERHWGLVNREVPMSRVCQTESFAWFACSILRRLPEFHRTYNDVVHDYRQAHRIRSRNHPVPDLAIAGDWLEAPFWAWRRGQSQRGKLFVRPGPNGLTLRIGSVEGPTLPADDLQQMVDAWRELEPKGIKVRSRALTTTMFARLFLADLFLHGIGGGIYDELTDRIIERFYALPAPAYLVVSATLLLPLERHADASVRFAQLARRQRDLIYKPELYARQELLTTNKRDWNNRQPATHAERVERFERIRAINAQLQPFVAGPLREVKEELEACRRLIALDEVARRRDYAFCLYPEAMLREFYSAACGLALTTSRER